MRVRVTDDAKADLRLIKAFISERNVIAADRVIEQIRITIRLLGEWPRAGHDGIVEDTYDKAVPRTPYVVVYRIDVAEMEEELVVLRVPHAAQERSRFEL
jgi:plasmid stabilization system protein ParE